MTKVLEFLRKWTSTNSYAIFKSFRNWTSNGFITRGKAFYSGETTTKNVVKSPLGEVFVPNILFHEFIFQNWSLWERKAAVQCGKTGIKYSYKNILLYSKALGATFQNKLNLRKGDVIAIVLFNCPEYPVVVLAASRSGVVPTIINPFSTAGEIKCQLKESGAKLIITHSLIYIKCLSVVQSMKAAFPILVVKSSPDAYVPEEAIDLNELFDPTISGAPKPVDINPDDALAIPFSKGTTGSSKGVILTHKSVVANMVQLSHPESLIISPTTWLHQETVFLLLPMSHIYGLMVGTFFPLKNGCRVVTLPKFNRNLFLKNLAKRKPSILHVMPNLMEFLSSNATPPKFFRHIAHIISSTSPLPPSHAHGIWEKAEHVGITQAYGMTESSALTHTSSKRMQKINSIGIPVASTQLKIVNIETGAAVSKGEPGELCALGPQLMKRYLNRSKTAFDEDGWLRTGDFAYYDEDGDFYLVGRVNDLIKTKGFQVSPTELEEVLKSHPKIKDAVVIGIPHPLDVQVPKAFIMLKSNSKMTEEEVMLFMKKKLSHYKQLTGGVEFVNNFPISTPGKILLNFSYVTN